MSTVTENEHLQAGHPMHALSSQVGGHPGVMASEDGEVIIKPCLVPERLFYEAITQDERYRSLRRLVPRYFGTLKLEGRLDPAGSGKVVDIDIADPDVAESIVLENISASFKLPNIMDAKLGTVLYDEDASDEKKARMDERARQTTSYETGVRLTGFQVYDHDKQSAEITPKSYGYSLKPSQLSEGIAKFFPTASSDKTKPAGKGLPIHTLLPILKGIKREIERIKSALEGMEFTMIGGSLLIVYEADWERASSGLEYLASRSLDFDEEEEEEEEESEEEEEEAGVEQDDEGATKTQESTKKPGPPFKVRLIDFAHTHFVPGHGPDHRVLKGINTILSLLEGKIAELSKAQRA